MKMKNLLMLIVALAISSFVMGQSASATYTAADIPTTYGTAHSPTCSGAAHPLTVTMPAGSYTITSVDVVYDMTSVGAWMSEQRSRLACQTTGTNEGTDYAGVGSSGTYSYNRSGLTFTNGTYSGNLIFENWAFRRYYNPTGCSSSTVKVDNGTWTVTVNYTVAPTCPDPSAQTESTIEANSAILGWTENGTATSWDIELGANGFSPTGTPTQSGVTNPYTYESLTRNTSYDWYVRADCSGGDYSNWVGPSTFTTTVCDVFLNNDFETGDFTSWTVTGPHNSSVVSYSGSWTGYIDVLTGYASGSPYDPSNTNWETISQVISICDEAKSLCFDMAVSGSSWNDCGQVWLKDAVGTYTRLFRSERQDPWASRAVNIEDWAGETVTIYFAGYNGNGYSDHQADIYFDNVILSEQGVPPTALTETNITYSGADLGWTNNNTYFDLYIVTSGSPAPTAGTTPTIDNTTNNPYTWSGGNQATDYDWYVRTDYAAGGGSGQSPWSESSTFTTRVPPITTFPALENFESFTVATNATGYKNNWSTSPSGTTSSFRWNVDNYRTPSSNTGPQNDHTLGTSAGKFLYTEASNAGTYAYVYSPDYDLTGLTNLQIEFWYHMYGATMGELHLDISTDGGANWTNDITAALIGQQHTSMTAAWLSRTVDLSAYSDQTVSFRFRGKRGTSYTGDMAIDDVTVSGDYITATWAGSAKSNDWHTAGNWNTGIPGTGTDVTIPTGITNYPTLSAAGSCNNITIKSDATGDASLLDAGNLTVNGSVTAERYTQTDKWHTISPSVSGAFADVFHFGSSTGYDVYLLEHSEATSTYTFIVPTTTPLNVMQGYFVWGDGANATPVVSSWIYEFTGGLNTGTLGSSNNLTRTDNSPYDTLGWNFVGNPYNSAIDWDAGTGWTKTNIDATIYVYNSPQWATYSQGSGGTNGGSQYIPMGQGFFVRVSTVGTGTLIMDNNVRVHNGVGYLKSDGGNYIKLQTSGNDFTDETSILFREDATVNFDNQYDAYKLFSMENNVPQIYSLASPNMAVNVLPETECVQLGFEAGINGEYTISAIEINDIPSVWLEDTFTGEFINLISDSYTFVYSTDDNVSRFIVHFLPMSTPENAADLFNIYSYDKQVYISVPENTKGNIFIYNMMGQEVASAPINSVLNIITLEKSAYYLVKVLSEKNVITKKIFIK